MSINRQVDMSDTSLNNTSGNKQDNRINNPLTNIPQATLHNSKFLFVNSRLINKENIFTVWQIENEIQISLRNIKCQILDLSPDEVITCDSFQSAREKYKELQLNLTQQLYSVNEVVLINPKYILDMYINISFDLIVRDQAANEYRIHFGKTFEDTQRVFLNLSNMLLRNCTY